jgi:transposase
MERRFSGNCKRKALPIPVPSSPNTLPAAARPSGQVCLLQLRLPCCPARQIRWALLSPEERLTEEQQAIRGCVLQAHPQIALAVTLVHEFAAMLRDRKGDCFLAWLAAMEQSRIPECRGVAIGMKGDLSAIAAALESEVSNGQVEGHVHRLKLIKRMMYGRAGFPLLRQRVLQPI